MHASHGRWRIVSHYSFGDVLILDVEALNLKDAREICRRLVTMHGAGLLEILVYARPEGSTSSDRIVRVRWSRDSGYDVLTIGR
jgi:hypothetical protein